MTPNEKNIQCRMRLPDLHIDLYLYQEAAGMYYQCFFKNKLLFSGNQVRPSILYPPYKIKYTLVVLEAITLQPGDTDREHFNDYTPERLAWCQTMECQLLKLQVFNYMDGSKEQKDEAQEYFQQHFTRYRHPQTIFSLNDLTEREEGTIYITHLQKVSLKSILLKNKPAQATTKKILEALEDNFRKLEKGRQLETILFDEDKVTFKPKRNSKKELSAIIKHITQNY